MSSIYKFRDYSHYTRSQQQANSRKAGLVWATDRDLERLVRFLPQIPNSLGVCHGARTNFEVNFFRDCWEGSVIGTDINGGKGLIRWDFHHSLTAGAGGLEWIYTNAFDHAFDPEGALISWALDLAPTGQLFLHWSPDHDGEADEVDCFRASREEYHFQLVAAGYYIMAILECHGDRCIFLATPNQ